MRLTAIAEDKEDVLEDRSVCRELFDQGAQISCFFLLFFLRHPTVAHFTLRRQHTKLLRAMAA